MNETSEKLISIMKKNGVKETCIPRVYYTDIPGIYVYKQSQYQPPTPTYYYKAIGIVGQGKKTLYFEDKKLDYDVENYIVFSIPLPVKSEIFASEQEPFLSLLIDFDLTDLSQVIEKIESHSDQTFFNLDNHREGFFVSQMRSELNNAFQRLLMVLLSPERSAVMGKGLIHEILYWVLLSENGASLYSLIAKNSNLSKIEKAVKSIHTNYSKPISVDELANLVNMSNSAFYRAFREVTTTSPIQYIKKTRLNYAKQLILENKLRVGEVALAVGYESVTQFSREFKRHFGSSPVEFLKRRN